MNNVTKLSDVVKSKKKEKYEQKLAYCEEYFYRFTSSTIHKKDSLVFAAFLVKHVINIIDAVAYDDSDEDLVISLTYLNRLSEKMLSTYMSDYD